MSPLFSQAASRAPSPTSATPEQGCPPSSSSLPWSTALCPPVLSEPFQQVWPQNTSLLVAREPGLRCGGDQDVAGQPASASKSTIPEQTQPALNPGLLPHPLRAAPSPRAIPTIRPSVADSAPISSVISTSSACLPLNSSPGKGFEEDLHDLRAQGWGKFMQAQGPGCKAPVGLPAPTGGPSIH